MDYTIKVLADLAGVTTRTLRWYDSKGLLKPCRISEAGYRIYGSMEVDRLQQILLYRELGLELAHIRRLLDDPAFDREMALQSHLAALKARRTRLDGLILTIERTLEGAHDMSDWNKFEGFKQHAIQENEEAYGAEIRTKYGEETVELSKQQFQRLTQAQMAEWTSLSAELQTRLERAVAAKQDPTEPEGLALAALHRHWLSFTWPSYTPQAHKNLGEMYVADRRFTAFYDKELPGCANFLSHAIAEYVKTL